MDHGDSVWLAADYHLPATYSCRVPMSSMSSALAMPAPGPGTVRLALIRIGIELFGLDGTRAELFPVIRSADIRIRPPEQAAISTQLIRGYKASADRSKRDVRLGESILYREFAHATGPITVYSRIPRGCEESYCEILRAVGYWGQASSLSYCVGIQRAAPDPGEVATPLNAMVAGNPTRQFFSCFVSELRDAAVTWEELLPAPGSRMKPPISISIYVWPMVVCEQQGGGKLLRRRSLRQAESVEMEQ